MSIKKLAIGLFSACALLASAANATSVTYTNLADWQASTSGISIIDFDTGTDQVYRGSSYVDSGVTFTAPAVFSIYDINYDAAYHTTGYLDLQGSSLGMSFGSGITSLSFNFGDFYSAIVNASITLSNGDVFNVNSPSNAYGFFGVTSDTAFNSISINTSNSYTAFDNVSFGTGATVPEPGSLVLLGGALFAAAFARRRQTK